MTRAERRHRRQRAIAQTFDILWRQWNRQYSYWAIIKRTRGPEEVSIITEKPWDDFRTEILETAVKTGDTFPSTRGRYDHEDFERWGKLQRSVTASDVEEIFSILWRYNKAFRKYQEEDLWDELYGDWRDYYAKEWKQGHLNPTTYEQNKQTLPKPYSLSIPIHEYLQSKAIL